MSARHDQALAWLGLDVDTPGAAKLCSLIDDGWAPVPAGELRPGDGIVLHEVDGVRIAYVANIECGADGRVHVTTFDGTTEEIDPACAVLVQPASDRSDR